MSESFGTFSRRYFTEIQLVLKYIITWVLSWYIFINVKLCQRHWSINFIDWLLHRRISGTRHFTSQLLPDDGRLRRRLPVLLKQKYVEVVGRLEVEEEPRNMIGVSSSFSSQIKFSFEMWLRCDFIDWPFVLRSIAHRRRRRFIKHGDFNSFPCYRSPRTEKQRPGFIQFINFNQSMDNLSDMISVVVPFFQWRTAIRPPQSLWPMDWTSA